MRGQSSSEEEEESSFTRAISEPGEKQIFEGYSILEIDQCRHGLSNPLEFCRSLGMRNNRWIEDQGLRSN